MEGAPGQGEGAGTGGVEKQPCATPPQLVAGALDEQAAGGKPRAHRAPHVRDLVHVVLPQHVEGAYEVGAVAGEFEAAEFEADAVARRQDALRVDL